MVIVGLWLQCQTHLNPPNTLIIIIFSPHPTRNPVHQAVAGMMSFVKSGLVGGHCAARINALLEIDDEMIAQAALLNPAADGDDDGGKVGTTSARA